MQITRKQCKYQDFYLLHPIVISTGRFFLAVQPKYKKKKIPTNTFSEIVSKNFIIKTRTCLSYVYMYIIHTHPRTYYKPSLRNRNNGTTRRTVRVRSYATANLKVASLSLSPFPLSHSTCHSIDTSQEKRERCCIVSIALALPRGGHVCIIRYLARRTDRDVHACMWYVCIYTCARDIPELWPRAARTHERGDSPSD